MIALDRDTGAIVYWHQLPTSTNAPIAVFGNTVLVPPDGPGPRVRAGYYGVFLRDPDGHNVEAVHHGQPGAPGPVRA